ncbi:hypothetical protein FI667_g16028, partial [Globisporangium splendens]
MLVSTRLDRPARLLLPLDGFPVAIIAYGAVSTLYAVRGYQLVSHSVRHRRLVFPSTSAPFSTPAASEAKPAPPSTNLAKKKHPRSLFLDRILGVRGVFFEPVVLMRELVEIAIQTTQAYKCSMQTSKFWINATFAGLVVANCFSSSILRRISSSLQGKCRVVVLTADLVLDLVWFVVIPTLLWVPYYLTLMSGEVLVYEDTYVIQAVMEMPMLFVKSYLDLAAKLWPPISICLTLRKIEMLVRRRQSTLPDSPCCIDVHTAIVNVKFSKKWIQLSTRIGNWLCVLLGCWGILIAIVFIVAVFATTPECHPGCLLVLQPWFHAPQRCQCAVLEVNCFALGISGAENQIRPILHATNARGLLGLIFTHCPALEMPREIHRFSDLFGFTLFNCSIALWDDSAAITGKFFPHLGYFILMHTFISEIPLALAHSNLPRSLSEIDIVVSNLSRLPENLNEQWPHVTTLYLDHGHFDEYPMVLSQMHTLQTISLFGNQIRHIPDDAFTGNPDLQFLSIATNPMTSLPKSLAKLESLVNLQAMWTNIVDTASPLVNASSTMLSRLTFFGFESPFCDDVTTSIQTVWLHCTEHFAMYHGMKTYSYYPLEAKLAEKQAA